MISILSNIDVDVKIDNNDKYMHIESQEVNVPKNK